MGDSTLGVGPWVYRLSFTATVSGIILQLAGLALDATLHAGDASLAAREGPFTLNNPGHLVFFVGLTLTVLGVSTTLLVLRGANSVGPVTPGASRGWRMTTASMVALLVVVVLALAGGAFALGGEVFSGDGQGSGQDHHEADGSRVQHPETRHPDEIDVSWEQLRETDYMLAEAKSATEEYRDVERALADGYQQVMGPLYGTGAHFVKQQHLDDGGFDAARPEALLYDRAEDGSLELVGAAYMLPRESDDETPPTYFGPLARWHAHDFHRPCLTNRTSGHPVTIHSTNADCRNAGNVFIPPKFWMLHVWLFRPSPKGVFSHENSTIEGPPDISVKGKIG